jgi:hypothetical protein
MEDAVLDMVAIDGLPFSICSMVGFNEAMKTLAPNTPLMSRWTVPRALKRRVSMKVKPHFEGILEKLPPKCLSVMLDFWTSRLQQSVIGVKVQYISSDWVLHNAVMAFKHCEGSLTGENIESIVTGILNEYSVTRNQINCIMADNAANIDKAFRKNESATLIVVPDNNHHSIMIEDIEPNPTLQNETEDEYEINEVTGQTDDQDVDFDAFVCEVDDNWNRKRCLCHILNLVVKGAIKTTPSAQLALDKVKSVTSFFRKSNLIHERLKKKTNNVGLRAPVDTRWNSWLLCIERILEVCF